MQRIQSRFSISSIHFAPVFLTISYMIVTWDMEWKCNVISLKKAVDLFSVSDVLDRKTFAPLYRYRYGCLLSFHILYYNITQRVEFEIRYSRRIFFTIFFSLSRLHLFFSFRFYDITIIPFLGFFGCVHFSCMEKAILSLLLTCLFSHF